MTNAHSSTDTAWLTVLALMSTVPLSACTDVERCREGTNGCVCVAGACATPDLSCREGLCTSCTPGQLGCTCTNTGCTAAGVTCVNNVCVTGGQTVCMNACRYSNDGTCDDGGSGAIFSLCTYGTDCADCGARPNPCAEDNPSYPVYCPQTPDVAGGECWGTGTNCFGLSFCDGGEARACLGSSRYDCDANVGTGGCTTNPCTNPSFPTFCPYEASCLPGSTSCCFSPYIDCRTVAPCENVWFACWTGERVDCVDPGLGDEKCVLD